MPRKVREWRLTPRKPNFAEFEVIHRQDVVDFRELIKAVCADESNDFSDSSHLLRFSLWERSEKLGAESSQVDLQKHETIEAVALNMSGMVKPDEFDQLSLGRFLNILDQLIKEPRALKYRRSTISSKFHIAGVKVRRK